MILLFVKLSMFADIALPKTLSTTITKYYFANADSFTNYKFFVKNLETSKTYKIKKDATFSIIPDKNKINNRLEVWAINKTTNEMTNTFILGSIASAQSFEENTAHIAITFYFDKKKNLSYKKTIMKPDCYSRKKKSAIPFFTINKPTENTNLLAYISLFSLLSLASMFAFKKFHLRKTYA